MRLVRFAFQGYKNFRQRVELSELGPVNIIHGGNNAGKSNLLEAIQLFFVLLRLLHQHTERTRRPRTHGVAEAGLSLTDLIGVTNSTAQRLGFPVEEIFHLETSTPIDLEGDINFTEAELVQAGLDTALAVGPVTVALRVSRLNPDGMQVVLHAVTISDESGKTRGLLRKHTENAIGVAGTVPRTQVAQTMDIPLAGQLITLLGAPPQARAAFALVKVDRRLSGDLPAADDDDVTESERSSDRDLIPADLCLALFDASQAEDTVQHQRWDAFRAELADFRDLLGPGEVQARFDRTTDRAHLLYRKPTMVIPFRLLGAGIQQIVSLLGRVLMSRAPILGMEEPELGLQFLLQLRLREALNSLTERLPGGLQLFLSSHSPAFETGDHFYFVEESEGGPTVTRRPVSEAVALTRHTARLPPGEQRAPLCYVTREGLVLVPDDIRERLGVAKGGGVYFIEREDSGHVELLSNQQYLALLRGGDA